MYKHKLFMRKQITKLIKKDLNLFGTMKERGDNEGVKMMFDLIIYIIFWINFW